MNQHLEAAVEHVRALGLRPTATDDDTVTYGKLFNLYVASETTVRIEWHRKQKAWEELQLETWSGWCYSTKMHVRFAEHVERDLVQLLKAYRECEKTGEHNEFSDLGGGLSKKSCKRVKKLLVNADQP